MPFLDRLGRAAELDLPPAGGVLHPGPRRRRARARPRAPAGGGGHRRHRRLGAGERARPGAGGARGGVVAPDSGGPGYDGVQAASNPDPFYFRPDNDAPRHPGALAAAQGRFRAGGLRRAVVPGGRQPRRARPGRGARHRGDRGGGHRRPAWSPGSTRRSCRRRSTRTTRRRPCACCSRRARRSAAPRPCPPIPPAGTSLRPSWSSGWRRPPACGRPRRTGSTTRSTSARGARDRARHRRTAPAARAAW